MDLNQMESTLIKKNRVMLIIIALSVYIIQIRSFGTHNMSYYILWARSIVEGGLIEIYHANPASLIKSEESLTVPYTPLSQYLIAGVSWLFLRVLNDSDGTYIISVNVTCVLFTFLTALLYYKNQKIAPVRSPIIYLVTPAVLLSSPILGYEDSIMAFFIVAALIFFKREKFLLAGVLSGCAIFSKQLAIMPIVAIFLLLLLTKRYTPLMRAAAGAIFSSALILAPFIISGNLIYYFKAQGLASVHTMASAQGANFPWLGSLIYRVATLGTSEGFVAGGNGLRIPNDSMRQEILTIQLPRQL
jgi:Gpi18-like mannosyltransferase